ncbi:MAG: GTP 3',8-cyclase MoaA, partial [Rhizobium oryzihabitans]
MNSFPGSLGKAQFLTENNAPMVDPFGRAITYLRVSVTDRCDFRCTYCMSEHMTFL